MGNNTGKSNADSPKVINQATPPSNSPKLTAKSKLDKQSSQDKKTSTNDSPSRSPSPHLMPGRKISRAINMQRKVSQQVEQSPYAPLHESQKTIIRECWNRPNRQDVGARIYKRVFSKREDVRCFYLLMEETAKGIKTVEKFTGESFSSTGQARSPRTPEEDLTSDASYTWLAEAKNFKQLLDRIVENIDRQDYVEEQSFEWGRQFFQHRDYGFKPSYWVPFSEAITTECMYLDHAAHPPGEVIDAWSSLVTVMLGRMRDGYYFELRLQRQKSRHSNHSNSSSRKTSVYSQYLTSPFDAGERDLLSNVEYKDSL